MVNIVGVFFFIFLTFWLSDPIAAKEFEWTSVGVRGAMNIPAVSLPKGEKEDFEQFDIIGTLGFPGQWTFWSDWNGRYQMNFTAGGLRGAGEWGFIHTTTVGLAFSKPTWRFTLDVGAGGALLSKWKFGDQDMGGAFQFIGHGGLSYHLPWNMIVGYRFHHMSDGDLYGSNRGVDLHMIELRYAFSTP